MSVTLLSIAILASGFVMSLTPSEGTIAQSAKPDSLVSFVATFDINKANKDGYYVNEYVISIDDKQAKKINGKKIMVTGVVTIVKGLALQPEEKDLEGNKIYKQGREQDTRYILSPSIEVLQ